MQLKQNNSSKHLDQMRLLILLLKLTNLNQFRSLNFFDGNRK